MEGRCSTWNIEEVFKFEAKGITPRRRDAKKNSRNDRKELMNGNYFRKKIFLHFSSWRLGVNSFSVSRKTTGCAPYITFVFSCINFILHRDDPAGRPDFSRCESLTSIPVDPADIEGNHAKVVHFSSVLFSWSTSNGLGTSPSLRYSLPP